MAFYWLLSWLENTPTLSLHNAFLIYRLVKGSENEVLVTFFYRRNNVSAAGTFFLLFQKVGSVGRWEMKKILGWPEEELILMLIEGERAK